MAVGLIENDTTVPEWVRSLYDKWRGEQQCVSLETMSLESRRDIAALDALVDRFASNNGNKVQVAELLHIFGNLKQFVTPNGQTLSIDFKEEENEELRSRDEFKTNDLYHDSSRDGVNGDEATESISWKCRKCWFQNGIQKVDGIWYRFCDADYCGFCGSSKLGEISRNFRQRSVEVNISSETSSIGDSTPGQTSGDFSQSVQMEHLKCPHNTSNDLCAAMKRVADALRDYAQFCRVIDARESGASLDVTAYAGNVTVEHYKQCLLGSVQQFCAENESKLKDSGTQEIMDMVQKGIDEFVGSGEDIVNQLGARGKRIKEFLNKQTEDRIKKGFTIRIYKKLLNKLETAVLKKVIHSLRDWKSKLLLEALQTDYEHILQVHLKNASEEKEQAIHHFFEEAVHSGDDEKIRNICLDLRKSPIANRKDAAETLLDSMHCHLCHHPTVEKQWAELIDPVQKWDVAALRDFVEEKVFSEIKEDQEAQSLTLNAMKQCCIDGKTLMSQNDDFIRKQMNDAITSSLDDALQKLRQCVDDSRFEGISVDELISVLDEAPDSEPKAIVISHVRSENIDGNAFIERNLTDLQFANAQLVRSEKAAMGLWHRVHRAVYDFNFKAGCTEKNHQEEVDDENDYGYPVIHHIFKRYLNENDKESPDSNTLMNFAKKKIKSFKGKVPGALQQDAFSYFEARMNDVVPSENVEEHNQEQQPCLVMKRVHFILGRFHKETRSLTRNGRYRDGMRHFVGNLPGYSLAKLQNDIDHVMNHKWKGDSCPDGDDCIHSRRSLRDRQNVICKDLIQKKEFFRTDSPADFVAISMLDRLHCLLHHDGDMVRGDKEDENLELVAALKKDLHSTRVQQEYLVYDTGNYVDYPSLKPMHRNLKEEIMNNRLCSITEQQFNEHLKLSQLVLDPESNNTLKSRKAWRADEANDVMMDEGPRIEHVLCMKLYCNDDALCKEFCNSFRSIKDGDGSESKEEVLQNHTDNFYWFGRYLSCAIELFGDTATKEQKFYRGLNRIFLFNQLSSVYEIPSSTTYELSVAHQFAGDHGMVIQLSPKFKNEINSSRYLSVCALGISEFDNEKERLFAGMTILSIVNIFNLDDNGWAGYKKYIDVMLYFERIIEQNVHIRDHYCHGVVLDTAESKESWKQKQMDCLIPLIRSHVTQSNGHKYKIPQYVYDLFVNLCHSKKDYIDLSCIHEERSFMCKSLSMLFFTGNPKELRVNSDRIKDMFPKLKAYRNEHGLIVDVAQIPVNHEWYKDIERSGAGSTEDDFDEEKPEVNRASEFKKKENILDDDDDQKYPDQMPIDGDNRRQIDSISKPLPGDYWKDQYDNKVDPRGEPSVIKFKWKRNFKRMDDCDTLHMLYLLQQACELHRRRVIDRNKYFMSISRADRYIQHVDTPQIITNFILWHNEDREKNVFTGDMIKTKEGLFVINDMISDIGGIKKGPATRIYSKLRKEVMIEYDDWTETGNTKLELETWGLTKLYPGDTVLEECTVEQIITLLTFVNEDEQKGDDDEPVDPEELVQGVFAYFEATASGATRKLVSIDGWKDTFMEWVREEKINGKAFKIPNKQLSEKLRPKLEADERKAKKLNGPCGKIFNHIKTMPVHLVLEAAKAKKAQ